MVQLIASFSAQQGQRWCIAYPWAKVKLTTSFNSLRISQSPQTKRQFLFGNCCEKQETGKVTADLRGKLPSSAAFDNLLNVAEQLTVKLLELNLFGGAIVIPGLVNNIK